MYQCKFVSYQFCKPVCNFWDITLISATNANFSRGKRLSMVHKNARKSSTSQKKLLIPLFVNVLFNFRNWGIHKERLETHCYRTRFLPIVELLIEFWISIKQKLREGQKVIVPKRQLHETNVGKTGVEKSQITSHLPHCWIQQHNGFQYQPPNCHTPIKRKEFVCISLWKSLISRINKAKWETWPLHHWNKKNRRLKTPLDYVRRVIWLDESRFCLVSDRPQDCIHRPREEFHPSCIQLTAKFGGREIMARGCLSVGHIVWLKSMNAAVYTELLEHFLLDVIDTMFPEGGDVFQQGNAPCHRAKSVQRWMCCKNIDIIENWPPQSPDLNIIGNFGANWPRGWTTNICK